MNFPIVLVFPKGDTFVMEFVQTDMGRVQQPKTLSAHSVEELDALKRIGWVEKNPPAEAEPVIEEPAPVEEPQ